MHPKLFIFGVFILLTYRTIEGQSVEDDGFLSETNETEVPSDESSTEPSINVNQSTEYQDIKNLDEDVSESLGRKPGRNPNIVKPDPLKPNAKPPLHPNQRPPPNPNARPSPNPNHRPSRPPPTPPTRPTRPPPTRPSPTPAIRPSHTPPTRPSPTPTKRYRPDRTPTPSVTQKHTTPSQTPKPNTPESTTHSVTPKPESTTHGQTPPHTSESTPHSQYQTTPGYNAGFYTSTQHFTDKVNGWLNVASGASDQLNREISKWKTLNTTPYNVGSADVTPETPSDGNAVDDTYGSDVSESSTTDSTPVDDWTPVSPDVTEPNSTDIPTDVDETTASSDTSKVDETTSDMDQTPGLV